MMMRPLLGERTQGTEADYLQTISALSQRDATLTPLGRNLLRIGKTSCSGYLR